MQTEPCPCGATHAPRKPGGVVRPRAYAECCGPCHAGGHAATPEALMRSRYSAYVKGLADYVRATWHPSTCPADLSLAAHTQWLGLTVQSARQWPASASTPDTLGQDTPVTAWGEVRFVARWREHGRGQRMTECSRFAQQAGRWWYVDGQVDVT